jgi:DNA-binding transcriptional LysR family regulator
MEVCMTRHTIGRLDTELLSAFVAVVDCGGFTPAAQRLGVTQSGVSMQIKRLEQRVGRSLLERSANPPQPTGDGRMLLDYARRITDLAEQARMRLAEPSLSGTVRVGLPEWFAGARMQRLVARFARAHPNVRLHTFVGASSNLRPMVKRGELEVALAIQGPNDTAEAVQADQLHWVVGKRETPEIGEELPLALFEPPCPYRDIALNRLTAAGARVREVFTSTSVASMRAAVEAGLAVSVFPESAIGEGLAVLDPSEGFPPLPVSHLAVYRAPMLDSGPALSLANYLEDTMESPQPARAPD